ncbi:MULTISPECIES: hypothetical protein [Calothrix]|uniref:Uncharacterized protein n=2 Tax=Calothrix TaxID=1186 RepID=A0ABR8A3U0_9CYAN|nr:MULTISPECIES: hypothetical protein [Calothrix]MBD2194600.1 hypothetical protein [Calothrix parietina FACHB-288]MBD2223294.1 hypothetical protein [Calothrix anomala FACHB-343]
MVNGQWSIVNGQWSFVGDRFFSLLYHGVNQLTIPNDTKADDISIFTVDC